MKPSVPLPLRLALLAMILLAAVPMAMAQSGAVTQTYCITGVSTAIGYAWWLDLGDDRQQFEVEPLNFSAPAVPRGSNAAALSAAFVTQIQASACHSPGRCLAAICVEGDPQLIGTPCATDSQCTTSPPICVEAVAADKCFTVSSPVLFALYVGPGNGGLPDCRVTDRGCRYNPRIRLVTP